VAKSVLAGVLVGCTGGLLVYTFAMNPPERGGSVPAVQAASQAAVSPAAASPSKPTIGDDKPVKAPATVTSKVSRPSENGERGSQRERRRRHSEDDE
jgi:hypothetical protein